jgi:hypothetical protein
MEEISENRAEITSDSSDPARTVGHSVATGFTRASLTTGIYMKTDDGFHNPDSMPSIQLTDFNPHQDEDPRIKSPDDILSKLSPRKPGLDIPGKTTDRAGEAARQLSELRSRYDQEIAQWRDYERRIQEWRAQVVSIVEGLRRDASGQAAAMKELEQCRAALKRQEHEIQTLRQERNRLKVVG